MSALLAVWQKMNVVVILFGTLINNFVNTLTGNSKQAQQINMIVCLYYGFTFLCGGRKIESVMRLSAENTDSMNEKLEDQLISIRSNSTRVSLYTLGFSCGLIVYLGFSTKLNLGEGTPMAIVMAIFSQSMQVATGYV